MKLQIISNYGKKIKIISKNTEEADVIRIMNSIDWGEFHQVVLKNSDNQWIQVGGSLNEDGLACIYQEFDEIFISDYPPESIKQMTDILISYLSKDCRFKDYISFSTNKKNEDNKISEKEKYENWKKNYQEKSIIEKKRQGVKFVLSLVITGLIISFFVLWSKGELKFIGQRTDFAKAEIVEIENRLYYGRFYFEYVTYEFTYNNEKYFGEFRAGSRVGHQEVGEFVKVKFSIKKPNRSEVVAFY